MKKLTIGFLLFCFTSNGQNSITLQSCIDKAKMNSNNFVVEYSAFRSATIEKRFHNWSLLPNLGAYSGFNVSFGRRLDPFTNSFATTSVNSHSLGLNSSFILFNGMNFTYKKNLLNIGIHKREISIQSKQNDITIQVIQLYIDLCKLVKQIEFANIRIEKYKQIQSIQRLLINGGKINEIDTLKSHNSLLNEQNLLLGMEHDIRIKTLDLNYLIGDVLNSQHNYIVNSISQISNKPRFTENYYLEQVALDREIIENQIKIDRANVIPSLSLNGLLGTGFSTNNKDYILPGSPTKPYMDQLSQNLYEGIGFYLSIPLFDRGNWFKTKHLNNQKIEEQVNTIAQLEIQLEKQKLEFEQKRIKNRSEQELTKQSADNFQVIYDKTFLLYSEGRATYIELETVFMDWQAKLVILEVLKLDYEIIKLYE